MLSNLAKYYSVDHALAASNGIWKTGDLSRALELIVCNELLRTSKNIFYWKSKKDFEVDFVITNGIEPISAIQVCFDIANADTYERETRALQAANLELGIEDLKIVTRNERRIINEKGVKIQVTPVIDWLLEGE